MVRTGFYILLIFLAGALIGGWLGYRVSERNALARETGTLRIALRAAELAVESANAAAADEQRRAVAAAIERNNLARQVDEVIADGKVDPGRSACEWDDSERMRIERLYRLYGFAGSPGAAGMSDAVQ